MVTLEFEVEGKSLRLTSQQILTSGSTNVDEVRFVFDASWDDFSVKTAIFYRNKAKCYVRILENGGCIVPSEVLESSGYLFVGVRGTNEDKNVNSEVVKYKIEEGALENAPDDPTKDVYDQILAVFSTFTADVETVGSSARQVAEDKDSVASMKDAVESMKTECRNAAATCTSMKSAVETMLSGISSEGIYGAKFCITDNVHTGTHTHGATGLTYHQFVGGSDATQIDSDFQSVGWWSLVKHVLKDPVTNEVVAYEGDDDYETKLDSGEYNVMTRFPRFYYDIADTTEDGKEYREFLMSLNPFAGSKVLASFKDDNGNLLDYLDMDSFKGGLKTIGDTECLVSMPGVVPLVGETIVRYHDRVEAVHRHLQHQDDQFVWLIPLIIETADMNVQSAVGNGICSTAYGNDAKYKIQLSANATNRLKMLAVAGMEVGYTVEIGNNYVNSSIAKHREIIAVEPDQENSSFRIVTIDGEPVTVTTDSWMTQRQQPVPLDEFKAMGKKCGYYAKYSNVNRNHVFVYGLADPWGNVFEVLANVARYNAKMYVNFRRDADIPSNFPANGWEESGDAVLVASGYIKTLDFVFYKDNLFLQITATGGDSTNPIGDYCWGHSENEKELRYEWSGGDFYSGVDDGAWHRYALPRSNAGIYYGLRAVS